MKSLKCKLKIKCLLKKEEKYTCLLACICDHYQTSENREQAIVLLNYWNINLRGYFKNILSKGLAEKNKFCNNSLYEYVYSLQMCYKPVTLHQLSCSNGKFLVTLFFWIIIHWVIRMTWNTTQASFSTSGTNTLSKLMTLGFETSQGQMLAGPWLHLFTVS